MRYLILLTAVVLTACGGGTVDPQENEWIGDPAPAQEQIGTVTVHWDPQGYGANKTITRVLVYDWYTDFRRDFPACHIEPGETQFLGELPAGNNYRIRLMLDRYDVVDVMFPCPVEPDVKTTWHIQFVRDL